MCEQLMQWTSELGVVGFKVESLQCKIALNPNTLQSLHLKVTPTPGSFSLFSQVYFFFIN